MANMELSVPSGREAPARAGGPASPARLPALHRSLGVDLRSLAAMRVGLGSLLLADLWGRAPYLASHYGEHGIQPRAALAHFSLHALGESGVVPGLLFALAAVFAAMLLAGWRTRLATCASWLLLVSLHLRNPLLLDGGDKLLALLLFWGMFLPLGARFSVDARLRPGARPAGNVIFSVASLALLLQVVFFYMFAALLKNPRLWVIEGSAVYYALSVDLITRPLGRTLLEHPFLLGLASRGSYLLELLGPLFVFVPVGAPYFRLATAGVFVAFHLLLAACLYLGLFPFICITAWLAFLPSGLWDRLERLRTRTTPAVSAAGGPGTAAPAPSGSAVGQSRAAALLAAACLAFVFYWNLGTIVPALEARGALARIGEQLCLRQRWSMFASPLRADGWWVMPAVLRDGSEVDLHTGTSPVRREKPEDVAATFPTGRHMKWLYNVWGAEHRRHIAHYADWLRRDWDSRHGPARAVEGLRILYRVEETAPPGRPPLEAELLIYEWSEADGSRVIPQEENLAALEARRAAAGEP